MTCACSLVLKVCSLIILAILFILIVLDVPPSPKYEESQFCIKYTMLQKDRIKEIFHSYVLSQLELKSSKLIILCHYQYYFLSLQV